MDCIAETIFALFQSEPTALAASLGEPEFRVVNSMRKAVLSLDTEFGCEFLSLWPKVAGPGSAG